MNTNLNLWPLGIVVTFGLFFAGMTGVVVIAATHREHLVNNNYYEQELKFQGRIEAVARAQTTGASIVSDPAAGVVIIAVPAAQLAQKFSGKIELYRPSAPELDREFPLEPRADGTQPLAVARLAAGLWVVCVDWNAGGKDYFMEQKITVTGK